MDGRNILALVLFIIVAGAVFVFLVLPVLIILGSMLTV